jgi:hypothetical protein
MDTTGSFTLTLSPIRLKMSGGSSATVEFASVSSRSPGTSETTLWSQLATKPVMLPGNIDSVFVEGTTTAQALSRIRAAGWNAHRLAFEIVDARTLEVLGNIGSERQFTIDGKYVIAQRGRLSNLANRDVFVRPKVRGMVQGRRDLVFTLVHVYTITESSSSAPARIAGTEETNSPIQIPTVFALHQNYPNPFNPSTQFNFDLPEAASVSLTVYDVLGREVATVVSEYRQAGYHFATWNADNVASGVYLARFTATDVLGQTKLTKMSKLVLLK